MYKYVYMSREEHIVSLYSVGSTAVHSLVPDVQNSCLGHMCRLCQRKNEESNHAGDAISNRCHSFEFCTLESY